MNCAYCVLDPDMKATQWNTAVTVWEGTAYCSKHLRDHVEAQLPDREDT